MEHYKYCKINRSNEVYLSNGPISVLPAHETLYHNVHIGIVNGVLRLHGEEIQHGFVFEDTPLEDLDFEIDEKYIKRNKGIKLFKWYLQKPFDYVPRGWYRLKENKSVKIVLSNYKLITNE